MTGKAVQQFQKACKKSSSDKLIKKLFTANERLAAEVSITNHINRGLQNALKKEVKKRKRGIRLDLTGGEESGPQFFSPSRVEAARTMQAPKETEELERRQAIDSCKTSAALKKLEKEQEKVQKAAALADKQRLATEAKLAKIAKPQARKELSETAPKKLPKRSVAIAPSDKLPNQLEERSRNLVEVVKTEVAKIATSMGSRVQLPSRFAN
ncbi:MAG: hypothetical protein M1829_000361 [Trizodia sp. TS-e1964]|nr:MAG: hypothetical protein M1829_000361 [Trizodia sp. TS-e1964]